MDAECVQLRPTHELNLQKLLAMGKGDGEDSYSKNSGIQAALNKLSLPALNEALERVSLPSSRIVVADLGSSSGPNAIDNMSLILDKLRRRLGKKCVEFQACFNDLPSNDFNNLFQLLSNDSRVKNSYVSGVPGSFYGRLFPESSVHVFFSSVSLHWLSQIPDAVLDEQSSTYNRGSSWIVNSRPAVAKSFQQQSSVDLKNFLSARAAELVSGGWLFFSCLGRSNSEPHEPTKCSVTEVTQLHADEAWSELVREGLVTEHDQDTFNFPLYLRSVEEVQEAIEFCGLFHVLKAELRTVDLSLPDFYGTSEPAAICRKLVAFFKAVYNEILETQVERGKQISAVFWERFAKSYEKRIRMSTRDPNFRTDMCVVSLIRK